MIVVFYDAKVHRIVGTIPNQITDLSTYFTESAAFFITSQCMEKVLNVQNVNDYARFVGAPQLHPLVSVIHYDELDSCRHSLNHYGVYGLFLMEESPYTISYGNAQVQVQGGTLMGVAPGQTGGISDNGEIIHIKGWVLLFHPDLLKRTHLEHRMDDFHFFSYYSSEALMLAPEEWKRIERCIQAIRRELTENPEDSHLVPIVVEYIALILEFTVRFYERQFRSEKSASDSFIRRLDTFLARYYAENLQEKDGIPTVRSCAENLFLSPNYFGDLVRARTGDSASAYIRRFLMERAKSLLQDGHTVSETAEALGFDYPQHFTRVFKKYFGAAPSKYVTRQ